MSSLAAHKPGKVIVIIGPSCAGKSTLAKAIQSSATEHFLHFSIDMLFGMVANSWGGGADKQNSRSVFWYEPQSEESEIIRCGPIGEQILRGMQSSVAAFLDAGANVIVDDMLMTNWQLSGWMSKLSTYESVLVNVSAPPDILRKREAARTARRRAGLAMGHLLLNSKIESDLIIDTSKVSPTDAAQLVLRFQRQGRN